MFAVGTNLRSFHKREISAEECFLLEKFLTFFAEKLTFASITSVCCDTLIFVFICEYPKSKLQETTFLYITHSIRYSDGRFFSIILNWVFFVILLYVIISLVFTIGYSASKVYGEHRGRRSLSVRFHICVLKPSWREFLHGLLYLELCWHFV